MKARIGVLLVCTILHGTARPEEKSAPAGQKPPIPGAKQAEQTLESFREASTEARKAAEQAQEEAERTWKIATQIRQRDEVLDPAPHRESKPIARSGNSADLEAYLAAKQIYLKANAESAAKADLRSEAVGELVEEERKPREEARARASQACKAAAALRQNFEIIDQDPEGDAAHVSSLSGDRNGVKTYLAAKAEYLKAKAELDKFSGFACRLTEKDVEVLMNRRRKQ